MPDALSRWFLAASLYLIAAQAGAALLPETTELQRTRRAYADAVLAIDRGQWTEYRRLRSNLDDYPLALYLDYFQLMDNPARVSAQKAARFVADSADSPLSKRFLAAYLARAGRERRWDDFLQLMPQPPRDIDLQCFYYRARLAAGEVAVAWQGAENLWVHGRSRPKNCDPLFAAWIDSGGITDDLVWARLKLVFGARQSSLLTYVARKSSADLQPWSDALLAVYRQPQALDRHLPAAPSAYRWDIVHLALRRLARYSPEQALAQWRRYVSEMPDETAEVLATERAIAFRALLEKVPEATAWLDDNLQRWADTQLTEIRLRWLLAEEDWPVFLTVSSALGTGERESSQWRYWRGVALEVLGQAAEARELFIAASRERGYYGFLAAERLGVPYHFNHQPLAPVQALAADVLQPAGLLRVGELQAQEEPLLAHAEWRHVLGREDRAGRAELARLAAGQGWYRLAIDAANEAAAYDALDLRFPLAYREVFAARGEALGVAGSELMSIARRESAFFPVARSSAGARGLMQVLPATGRQVARSIGAPGAARSLYDIEDNVLLGSAYYRQLLDRFSENRVLALAAYNAGPNRVDNWLGRKDKAALPLEVWIETIPYRETRDYVKAVLAYNVVFNYLQGLDIPLFRPHERSARY